MPKVKTNSSCKKRFKKNCNGKVKRSRAYRRHHAWGKSHKTIRKLRAGTYLESTQEKKIASLLQ